MKIEGSTARELGQTGGSADGRPRAGVVVRLVRVALGAGFWLSAAGTVFAFTWPAMMERTDSLSVWAAFTAFMARTMGMHLGVVCLAAAAVLACARMRRLSVCALLLAAVWLLPEGWKFVRPVNGPPADGQATLTVLSMNVCFGRSDLDAVMREVTASGGDAGGGADVVMFQEYTAAFAKSIDERLSAYPYRAEAPRDDAFGQAVFSKRPFVGEPELFPRSDVLDGRPRITVGVDFDGGLVKLTNVHFSSPTSTAKRVDQRREALELGAIARAASVETDGSGTRVERIFAGDFNATSEGSIMKAVASGVLTDAWEESSRGRGGTWCAEGWYGYFGYLRIDNQLRSEGLVCVGSGVGEYTGSDHYPTWSRYVRRK